MAINFDINDLLAFRAVAELGSFHKAAEVVHLSQPAFSRRIEKLEQALGVRLLDRTTRRVSLTTVGRDFAKTGQTLLDELDRALLSIRGVAANRMGVVTIACVPSTVYYFLSRMLRVYRERYPKTRVRVLDSSANLVLSAVQSGEADFGISFIGTKDPDLHFKTLLEERFVAACPKGHPLARRRRITWNDLARYDYISVDKTSGNRLLLDQALVQVKDRPTILYEASHVTTLLGMVEAGLGIAVVPTLAMPGPSHPVLVSVPIGEPVVTRRIGLIRRKGRTLTPAALALYDCFAALEPQGRKPGARIPARRLHP